MGVHFRAAVLCNPHSDRVRERTSNNCRHTTVVGRIAGVFVVKEGKHIRVSTATGLATFGQGPVGITQMTTTRQRDDATDESDDSRPEDRDHLDSVEDGCGCAEVWEHLSEQREAGAD